MQHIIGHVSTLSFTYVWFFANYKRKFDTISNLRDREILLAKNIRIKSKLHNFDSIIADKTQNFHSPTRKKIFDI